MRPLPDHTKLEVDPDGLEVLRAIPGPISPVVVIGPYRSGKSFLLNQLMGVSCGESRESGRGGAFGQQDGVAAPPAVAGSVPCALACRVPGWKRRFLLRPCWEVPWQHTHTHTHKCTHTHTRALADEGFGVGHSRKTETKGVWFWGEPIQQHTGPDGPLVNVRSAVCTCVKGAAGMCAWNAHV